MIRALTNGMTIQTYLKTEESGEIKPKIILQAKDDKYFLSQYEYTKLREFIEAFENQLLTNNKE